MQEDRLAVLIDADNAPRKSIKGIMEEIAVYGTPTIKRIYGDWTTPELAGWKNALLENAITPIQQYGYTTGKNSTDSAMIIDAMDLLYSGKLDAFCIVSSDSDFTRLAIRLREAGMKVIGIGEKKTPNPFIVACDKFIYIEIINSRNPSVKKGKKAAAQPAPQEISGSIREAQESEAADCSEAAKAVKQTVQVPQDILDLIATTIDDVADDDGWAYLGEVGGLLQKKRPAFDSRNYGYKKLTLMMEACESFELVHRENLQKGNGKLIYIRNKK